MENTQENKKKSTQIKPLLYDLYIKQFNFTIYNMAYSITNFIVQLI